MHPTTDAAARRKQWRWIPWLILGFIGVAGLAAGLSAFQARSRTLHVINATPLEARVSAGSQSLPVRPGQRGELRLPEGVYRLRVEQDGLPPAEVEARIETSFWTRLGTRPLFLLNVRGAGVVTWQRIAYAERVEDLRGRRHGPEDQLHLGTAFLSWPDVDHHFEPPPKEVRARKRDAPMRTVVDWHADVDPRALLASPPPGVAPERLLDYAEGHLACAPGDADLLAAWGQLAGDHPARAQAFLEAGLARRPIEVEWHRAWQELCPDRAAARVTYDAVLAATPDDATLLYLRGQLEDRSADACAFFQRALERDPDLGWARWALAVHGAARGEVEASREHARRAAALLPAQPQVVELWRQLSFAAGELDELEGELRSALRERPHDQVSHRWLLQVLIEREQESAAHAAADAFEAALAPEAADLGKASQAALMSMIGDPVWMESVVAEVHDEGLRRRLILQARLMSGRFGKLEPLLDQADGVGLLEAALARLARGQRKEADALIERARQRLQAGGRRERVMVAVLAGKQAIEDLVGDLPDQQVVAVVTAYLHPDRARPLLERARVRYGLEYPRPLIDDAIAALERRS